MQEPTAKVHTSRPDSSILDMSTNPIMVYGRQVDSLICTLGPIELAYRRALATLRDGGFVEALWSRRLGAWTDDTDIQARIGQRLGWLNALDAVAPHLDRIRDLAASLAAEGIVRTVLLGMGGSSLAPEVLRQVIGIQPGFPRFRMLDSVDPESVGHALDDVARSLFVFASKSGGTIEPNAMAAEAIRRLEHAGIAPGERFIAITDPGTALHQRAVTDRYRAVFVNPPDIGGRYSALSLFGFVPAALMGIDLDTFAQRAAEMVDACRRLDDDANPGVMLGAFMAASASVGRDKLTLLLPERLSSLGLWIEQLVAESTGKQGVGVVPLAGESSDVSLGPDRAIVVVHLPDQSPASGLLEAARVSGAPSIEIRMPDVLALGAEFFRWEFATATAGRLLAVNPFDEPNVQQAKDATKALLDDMASSGHLPTPPPDLSVDGLHLTLSARAREFSYDPRHFLRCASPGDYVSVMAFLPQEDEDLADALRTLRHSVAARTTRPTMFGYGPRYLHSTGQLHKGGANNGVFIVLTAPAREDLPVPGAGFSFGTLEQAQAIGDFQSLSTTSRRALFVRLDRRDPSAVATLGTLLTTDLR